MAGRCQQGGHGGRGWLAPRQRRGDTHEARLGGRELLAPGGSGDRRGTRGALQRADGGWWDTRDPCRRDDDDPRQRPGSRRVAAARAAARWRRGRAGRVQPAPSGVQEREVPQEAARRRQGRLEPHRHDQRRPRGDRQRSHPPRPAAGQRRQPVLARAARPGALRRQRLRGRGRQQRAPGAERGDRRRPHRRRGPEHLLRLPRGDQPHDRCVVGPDVIDPVCHYDPDNNRFMVVITTLHVAPTADVQREEHHRPGGLQHRRSDGSLDHLPRAGPERRHRRHAEPRLHARRHAARSVLPGLPAHRR